MVQVLPHTRAPSQSSDRPSRAGSECVCVGLGLLILNFLNNVSLKLLGSKRVGLGSWACNLQQSSTIDRIQLCNCCMAGL